MNYEMSDMFIAACRKQEADPEKVLDDFCSGYISRVAAGTTATSFIEDIQDALLASPPRSGAAPFKATYDMRKEVLHYNFTAAYAWWLRNKSRPKDFVQESTLKRAVRSLPKAIQPKSVSFPPGTTFYADGYYQPSKLSPEIATAKELAKGVVVWRPPTTKRTSHVSHASQEHTDVPQ